MGVMTKFVKIQHPRAKHRRLAVFQYRETVPLADPALLFRIYDAWRQTKSPLGYAPYTDIYSVTRIPYSKIFGVLKWCHKQNPRGIRFNIDRFGNNVYVKFIGGTR